MLSTHHVVQNCLRRMVLHQRNVLVGRCVKDNIWSVLFEYSLDRTAVPDTRYNLDDVLEAFLYLTSDLIETVFVLVEQNDLRRLKLTELANELRPNRSSGAGHQYSAAAIRMRQLLEVLWMNDAVTSE